MNDSHLLTIRDAAILCGYSEQELRKAVEDGELLGSAGCEPDSDRIKRVDLDAFRARLWLAGISARFGRQKS